MKFIRKNGKIIPIKDKNGSPSSSKKKSGSDMSMADYAKHKKSMNKMEIAAAKVAADPKSFRSATAKERLSNGAFIGTFGAAIGALAAGKKGAIIAGSLGVLAGSTRKVMTKSALNKTDRIYGIKKNKTGV